MVPAASLRVLTRWEGVHTFEPPFQNPRPSHTLPPGRREPPLTPRDDTNTPIYDTLCAEFQRLLRALPGDRSDEEDGAFPDFASPRTAGALDFRPEVPRQGPRDDLLPVIRRRRR